MEIRRTRLRGETEYFLDGAADCFEITAAAQIACMLYGDPDILDLITDNRTFTPEEFYINGKAIRCDRQRRSLELEHYAHSLIVQCPPARRAGLVATGFLSICQAIVDTSNFFACSRFEDMTTGGALLPFRRRILLSRDQRNPTKKTIRRLYSEKNIRRYIKAQPESYYLRKLFIELRPLAIDPPSVIEDNEAITADLNKQLEFFRETDRIRYAPEIAELGRLAGVKRIDKEKRRAVVKSANFAETVIGREAVSQFVAGRQIALPGQRFIFKIERSGSLFRDGHGSLSVAIHSLTDEKLCKVCVYQEDVPVLDQVAALGLHIASGHEQEILDTGNMYQITEAGMKMDAGFVSRTPGLSANARSMWNTLMGEFEKNRFRKQEYWSRTKDHYIGDLAVLVMGNKYAKAAPPFMWEGRMRHEQ